MENVILEFIPNSRGTTGTVVARGEETGKNYDFGQCVINKFGEKATLIYRFLGCKQVKMKHCANSMEEAAEIMKKIISENVDFSKYQQGNKRRNG